MAEPLPPSPEKIGRLFQRYRVIRELGRGGMGVVWLAEDEELGQFVALKLIPDQVARDTEAINDLRREVLRGRALSHPGIVRTHTLERDGDSAALVMEYVDGETLTDLKLRQPNQCFDPADILPWITQLGAILDYAHTEASIVHRDLKPRNLMLTASGRLKVADFGIAATLSDSNSRISVRSDASGTPCYMSPQQALGQRPSPLDDIYALGATVYELLTGKPPFFRGNIIAQVLEGHSPSMESRRTELGVRDRPAIPPHWEALVAACLDKDAARRPSSAGAALARLHLSPAEVAEETKTVVRPPPSIDLEADTPTQTAPMSGAAAPVENPRRRRSPAPVQRGNRRSQNGAWFSSSPSPLFSRRGSSPGPPLTSPTESGLLHPSPICPRRARELRHHWPRHP